MPGLYMRQKMMPDCVGRLDYMGNPERQKEKLLFFKDNASELHPDFWKQLHEETGKCEAREIHGRLPNSLLDRLTPEEIAGELERAWTERTGLPCALAVHQNKTKSGDLNLHFHLMYPERQFRPDPEKKVAERNLFYDEEGKRRYKKKDVLDEAGKLRPGCYVVPKGAIYDQRYFGPIEDVYSSKGWLRDMKETWFLPLVNGSLHGDVEVTMYDPAGPYLPQEHAGKGKKEDRIRAYNEDVKTFNGYVDRGHISKDDALRYKDLIALAPDRGAELQRVLSEVIESSLYKHGVAMSVSLERDTCQIGIDERTRHDSAEDAEKQELRQLYNAAGKAWSAYRTAEDPNRKAALLQAARAASAKIDAQRRLMGDYSSQDYQGLLRRQHQELQRRRLWISRLDQQIQRVYAGVSAHLRRLDYLEKKLIYENQQLWPDKALIKSLQEDIRIERALLREEREAAVQRNSELRRERKAAQKAYREAKQEYKDTRKAARAARRQEAITEAQRDVVLKKVAKENDRRVKILVGYGADVDRLQQLLDSVVANGQTPVITFTDQGIRVVSCNTPDRAAERQEQTEDQFPMSLEEKLQKTEKRAGLQEYQTAIDAQKSTDRAGTQLRRPAKGKTGHEDR